MSNKVPDLSTPYEALDSTSHHEPGPSALGDDYQDDSSESTHLQVEIIEDTQVHTQAHLLARDVSWTESTHRSLFNESSLSQEIEIDDEVHIKLVGYSECKWKLFLYYFLCVVSGGVVYLLCRWFPKMEIRMKTKPCPLIKADTLLLQNNWGEWTITSIACIEFDAKNGRLAHVFPNFFIKYLKERGSMIFKNRDMSDPSLWSHIIQQSPRMTHLRFFEYRYHTFIFNPLSGLFEPNLYWRDLKWCNVRQVLEGVDGASAVIQRQRIFGRNAIDVEEKPTAKLLVDEVLHPFYVFQVGSILLWMMDEYYYYAFCIFLISTSSAIFTLIETKQTMRKIREMSTFVCQMRVWRGGNWWVIPSHEVVPGDIFEVTTEFSSIVPCDAILLDGDCILNESMLTGESIPVSKTTIQDDELRELDFEEVDPLKSSDISRFFLFCGTKIIRVRSGSNSQDSTGSPTSGYPGPGAIAMVTRVGFNTTKGNLIRSMLFPKPNKFKFYRDSFRFIGVLTILAGLGFLASLYNFMVLNVGWQQIVFRALDLITIVVPPALPATMAIGTSFAISRLRKSNIFCISPPRVNICGKVDVICFDKTGTLTQEGLDVLGFRCSIPDVQLDKDTSPTDSLLTDSSYSPSKEEHFKFFKTRFSQLFKSASEVLPRQKTIDQKQKAPLKNSISPSKASILLGTSTTSFFDLHECTPGHPNTPEKPFPYPMIICAMATCHSIKVVNGEKMGDPMDLKMFEFTGWEIEEGNDFASNQTPPRPNAITVGGMLGTVVRPPMDDFSPTEHPDHRVMTELGVVRLFEFVSGLRRMSVVVRRIQYNLNHLNFPEEEDLPLLAGKNNKEFEVFVKGAPEVMKSICLPSTIPANYDELLKRYAHHGYRILACAYKKHSNLSFVKMMKLSRDQVEKDLQFLGFIIFENKLKVGTKEVIQGLNDSKIRQVMCTGDNILTSISVSRECSLIMPSNIVFLPRFAEGCDADDEDATLFWEDVDETGLQLDPVTLLPMSLPVQSDSKSENHSTHVVMEAPSYNSYDIAVTGDVFQWMLDYAPDDVFHRLLVKCQIFARMSPDQKHILVEKLQDLGYCVGFCGDGANDCGALKAADVGLSLSEAEASVAAPFTSRSTSLFCVPRLISEGRAALVTSFSCFKYMALYSLIQFTSVTLLYSIGGNLGDFQYLFIDLAIIIPVATSMGRSKPHPKLAIKRPTASLVSKRVLTSLIGQTLIQSAAQIFIYFWIKQQPYYEEPDTNVDEGRLKCYENTVVFLVSCYQYVIVAFVFSVGKPYRESIWKNGLFILTSALLLLFIIFITVYPSDVLLDILELISLPMSARLFILMIVFINAFMSWLCERHLFSKLAQLIARMTLEHETHLLRRRLHASSQSIQSNGRPNTHADHEEAGLLSGASSIESVTSGLHFASLRQEAKRERWKRKGKLFKVVEALMKYP